MASKIVSRTLSWSFHLQKTCFISYKRSHNPQRAEERSHERTYGFVRACVRAFVRACTHARTQARTNARTHERRHARTHERTHARTHASLAVCHTRRPTQNRIIFDTNLQNQLLLPWPTSVLSFERRQPFPKKISADEDQRSEGFPDT